MNRRELLRLFGVGATVIPIVGGQAVNEAASTLVEPASVELIDVPPVMVPGRATMGFYPVRVLLVDANNQVVVGGQIEAVQLRMSIGQTMGLTVHARLDPLATFKRYRPT